MKRLLLPFLALSLLTACASHQPAVRKSLGIAPICGISVSCKPTAVHRGA